MFTRHAEKEEVTSTALSQEVSEMATLLLEVVSTNCLLTRAAWHSFRNKGVLEGLLPAGIQGMGQPANLIMFIAYREL